MGSIQWLKIDNSYWKVNNSHNTTMIL